MGSPIIDIGIACSAVQSNKWWSPLIGRLIQETANGLRIGRIIDISSASPDHNKNYCVGMPVAPETQKKRNDLTDSNRVKIVETFMKGDAEWLFFLDDDTLPPPMAITKLLRSGLAGNKIIGGVYYNTRPPYNPIAYTRLPNGLYTPIWDFPYASLMPVDAIGMGCTLIHRSVFETIAEQHVLYQRTDGTLFPVHKSLIENAKPDKAPKKKSVLESDDGIYLIEKLEQVAENESRPWPFFAMEYGRTEDMYFCELAQACGIRIMVDTSINCTHWKIKPTTREYYLHAVEDTRE